MNVPSPQKSEQTVPPKQQINKTESQAAQRLAGSQTHSAVNDTNTNRMCLSLEPSIQMQETIYSVRETEDTIGTKLFGENMSQIPNRPNKQKMWMRKKWLNILSYVRV